MTTAIQPPIMDFSQGLQRPISSAYGCGHVDHYESVGKCVEGELIFCDYCGGFFFDKDHPQVYTDEDNAVWYEMFKTACCPCPLCTSRNEGHVEDPAKR